MPDMIVGGRVTRQVFGQSFIDARGRTRSVSLRLGTLVFLDDAAVGTYSTAKARLSNAGLYETRITTEKSVIKTSAVAYDEAESSVDTVLVCIWENETGARLEDVIPAPDRSILTPDGLSLIPGDTAAALGTPEKTAATYREFIAIMLNGSNGGTWVLSRSYVSSYKGRGARGGVAQPIVQEPGAGDTPTSSPAP